MTNKNIHNIQIIWQIYKNDIFKDAFEFIQGLLSIDFEQAQCKIIHNLYENKRFESAFVQIISNISWKAILDWTYFKSKSTLPFDWGDKQNRGGNERKPKISFSLSPVPNSLE